MLLLPKLAGLALIVLINGETPDRVSISIVGHTGPMIEGEQYELQCDIQNVAPVELLTVNWYKGDTLVKNNTFIDTIKTPVNLSDTLQISPSRDDDGAQYRCEAELDMGPEGPQSPPTVTSDLLTITVHETPDRVSISIVGHTGPMIEGRRYELQCDIQNAASVELLTVSWYKGDTLVENNTFIDTIKTPVNLSDTLQIFPSRDDDGAQYRCEAELDMGPDGPQPPPTVTSDPLTITVHETQERVSISTVGHTGLMIEGRWYELQCDIQNAAPVEFLTVNWYKGDTLVDNKTFNDTIKTPVNLSDTLQISPSRDDDGAQYRCEAELDLGPEGSQPPLKVTSDPLTITVHETPERVSISIVGHTGPMIEGEQYELQCDIQNAAPVEFLTVNWYKGDTLVDNKTFNDTIKTPVNLSDTLQISPSRDDDGAQYRCEAELDLGPEGPQPPPTVISDPLTITVHDPCLLTLQPPKVVVEYGGSASANCSTSIDHVGIGWEASEGAVDMTPDVQLITWNVDRLVEWGIKPFCFMNPNSEKQCKADLHVIIYKTPERVSISIVGHTGPMIEGRRYELQCDIQNVAPVEFLTVNWYKGDTLVANKTFNDTIKTPVNLSDTLQISPSRDDDGAQYRCEAELDLGPEGSQPPLTVTSDLLTITVHETPERVSISTVGHTGPMIEGEQYELQCDIQNAASVELLTVNWYKGDTLVKNQTFDGPIKTPVNLSDTLQIFPSRDDDGAQYRCEAELDMGPDGPQPPPTVTSDPLTITVHETQERVSISTVGHTGPMIEGRRYELQCDIQNVAPVEFLTVNWYKGDTLVANKTFNDTIKTPVNLSDTLQISPSRDDDGAQYRCEAELDLGPEGSQPPLTVTSDLLTITVHETPERVSISIVGHTGPMIEGRRYELQCDIQNVAPVELLTVSWYKGDTLVKNQTFTDTIKTPVNLSDTLQISPSRDDDGAQYRCEAELDLGPEGPQPPLTVISDLLTITVHDPCLLTLQPPQVVVEYGGSASANCSTSIDHVGIGWEASEGAVDMTPDVQLITWNVDRLVEWGIKPFCFMNPNSEKQCKADLHVIIYKTPERVSISTVGHTGPMTEGRRYELQCDIQNVAPVQFLTVTWYKGDTLVANKTFTDPRNSPVNRSDTLWISPSRDDDGAQYRCEAELDLGPEGPQPPPTVTSGPLNIRVHYKPVIRCFNWNPLINTTLDSFPLAVMGKPDPHIKWRQGLSWIRSTKHFSKKDSGPYEYFASNKIGNTSCVTNITVEYGPEFDCPSVHESREHTLFLANCTVMASPVANVSWSRDGRNVERPHNLTRRDNGLYIITAQNKHGTEHHHLTISVRYGPEIELGDESVEVYEGRDVTLPCTAEGNPEPKITWSFNNQSKTTGGRQTTLMISGATFADGGLYTCTATNTIGSQTRRVLLVVQEIPDRVSISTMGHSGAMTEGEQYELRCDVQNVSPVQFLTVSWFKGDTLVENRNFTDSTKTLENVFDTLQISPSREDNGAQYRCEAELDLGPDGPQPPLTVTSDPLKITVQYPCPVTLQPPQVVVEYGASASAICSTSVDHMGMGWEASEGAVDMTPDVQFISWNVDRLVEWGIKPFCFMNLNPEMQCKADLHVTIYKTPDRVSISTVGHTGPMIEGGRYQLQCDTENVAPVEFLTVSWYKGDTLVDKETFNDTIKTPVNRSSILQISPSSDDDGAQYRCVAELDLGPEGPQPPPGVTSEPLTISVLYKPVIHCSEWSPLINSTLSSYPHAVTGNPPPDIYWFQGQSEVKSTKRLSQRDSGLYNFTAMNTIGNKSCIIKITVEYGPKFDCPQSYENREHTVFSEICKVMASPLADITWYKDRIKVKPLHNLTRRDNGSYSITAWNKHGTKHHHLTINVLYGPEIESGDGSVEVYEGRDVTLSCTAEGNPEPIVKWSFNNQSKTTGGRQTTLTISGATSADGGLYTCAATNTIGSQKRRVLLVVQGNKFPLPLAIFIALSILFIVFCILIITAYLKRKRSGRYDVQCKDNATQMKLLSNNTQ